MHTQSTAIVAPPPGGTPPPAPAPPGTAWMDQASCATSDPEVWFADVGDSATVRAAKRVCARCPVQPECLEYALSLPGNPEGVWGGTSPIERRGLRAERRAA